MGPSGCHRQQRPRASDGAEPRAPNSRANGPHAAARRPAAPILTPNLRLRLTGVAQLEL